MSTKKQERRKTMKRLNSRWLVPFILLMLLSIAVSLPAADDILIGGALSLTGVQAPLDEPGLRGAKVAVKALNDSGGLLGKKVRFINLDGKSDPVTVGNIAIDLIDRGAKFIVAPCDFDFGGPASREAQKKDIIGISTCASDPLYSSWSLGDKQFTLSMWNTTMGATAAEYAFKERGWKTAYVVTDQFIAYTKSLSKYFVEHFKAIGGTILGEDTYTQGDQDFSAQLARLKALKKQPDVIFISSYMPDLGTIIRSIREVGITSPIMGGDSYDDPGLWEALGKKFGNNIYFVTHTWLGKDAKPEAQKFVALYKKMYGKAPDTSFVATGWDTIMLWADAVKKAGTTDGAAVAKVLESNQFDLLTGNLTYSSADTGHYPLKAAALVALKDAKPEFLGWRKPENPPAP
jgi:branched-chain amino acid transport system substrate-binding protein